jgi:hypothetical protein
MMDQCIMDFGIYYRNPIPKVEYFGSSRKFSILKLVSSHCPALHHCDNVRFCCSALGTTVVALKIHQH